MENRNEAVKVADGIAHQTFDVTDRRSSQMPEEEPILSDVELARQTPILEIDRGPAKTWDVSGTAPALFGGTPTGEFEGRTVNDPPRPKRTIIPWGERILVKPDPPEEFYDEAATLKKADVNQEKALEGTVVMIGIDFKPGYKLPEPRGRSRSTTPADGGDMGRGVGNTWAELKPGDKVGYVKFTGTEFNEDDEEFLMLRPDEVLCVILVG